MRRRAIAGTARFLTFSCHRRLPLFGDDKIKDAFADALTLAATRPRGERVGLGRDARTRSSDRLRRPARTRLGLSSVPQTPRPPSAVFARWRRLNAPVLVRLHSSTGKPHFWQLGGGYDRNVIDRELIEKIRYVHANPIRRGLCDTSVDWRWSSARASEVRPDAIGPPVAFDLIPNHKGGLT